MQTPNLVVVLFVISTVLTTAFQSPFPRPVKSFMLKNSHIDIIGKHLEVTPALKSKVEDKIGSVINKLGSDVIRTHVNLHVEKHDGDQAQVVEVTINMKGGAVIRAVVNDDNDMYASIDKVSHRISHSLKKHKDTHRGARRHQKVLIVNENQEELEEVLFDSESMPALGEVSLGRDTITRLQMFSVEPMTHSEAVTQMQSEGHQFFTFKNKETKEVNVIYIMKNGDIGLIQPSDDTLLEYSGLKEHVEDHVFTSNDETFPKISNHDSY